MPLTNNMSLAFNVENFLRNKKIFNIQPQETFDPNGQHTTSQQGKSEVIVGNWKAEKEKYLRLMSNLPIWHYIVLQS